MNAPNGLASNRCLLAALLLTAALSACAVAEDPADVEPAEATTPSSELPPLHLVRTLELQKAGQNPMQENYRQTEASCREAGWPVRPLTAAQVSKLGTQKLELMFDAGHRLARTTRWEWLPQDSVPEHLCLFRFVEHVDESYIDRSVSGGTGDGVWQEQPSAPEELEVLAVDDQQAAENQRIATQTGWSDAGVRKVAGQPCRAMTSDANGVEICTWSAGRAWEWTSCPLS